MIEPAWDNLWAGLPHLILQFAVTLAMLAAGLAVYLRATPYRELRLVRQGNVAAGITLAGAILGLAIPLAGTLASSVTLPDVVAWGVVAVVLQLATFGAVALLLRGLTQAIERGEVASALVLAAAQLAIGAVNAAAVSG